MIFALIKTKISVIKFGQNIFCSVLFVVGNKLELYFLKIIINIQNVIFALKQSTVVASVILKYHSLIAH